MAEVIVIEPGRYERNYWCDLWRYRELFRVLAWRDLAVRYKQTVIGIAWAVIRPFLTMLVLLISGRAIRVELLVIQGGNVGHPQFDMGNEVPLLCVIEHILLKDSNIFLEV